MRLHLSGISESLRHTHTPYKIFLVPDVAAYWKMKSKLAGAGILIFFLDPTFVCVTYFFVINCGLSLLSEQLRTSPAPNPIKVN